MIATLIGLFSLIAFRPSPQPIVSPVENIQVLSSHSFSLGDRYQNAFVNQVFAKNILLTLAYMRGIVRPEKPVNWTVVETPFEYDVTVQPKKVLTYHAAILPEFKNDAAPLTTIHFNSDEGFVSDGYLVGDGTCHLASLIAWAAKDAGLNVTAPTNHNFAKIPEVPAADGVAIYVSPSGEDTASEKQNLYIENNLMRPVTFSFLYDGVHVTVRVTAEHFAVY